MYVNGCISLPPHQIGLKGPFLVVLFRKYLFTDGGMRYPSKSSKILQGQPLNSKVPHLVKCFESQVILLISA